MSCVRSANSVRYGTGCRHAACVSSVLYTSVRVREAQCSERDEACVRRPVPPAATGAVVGAVADGSEESEMEGVVTRHATAQARAMVGRIVLHGSEVPFSRMVG